MENRACVLHKEKDLRVEAFGLATMTDTQVLVRIGAGGICGSDLHYYQHGGFGVVRVKQPIVLGHEVAGTVEATGAKVTSVKPGDRIALNPSRPCGHCKFCLAGLQMHCLDMWFYGSAMRMPHSQGAFRDRIVVEAFQCEPVGDDVSLGEAACAEPLAVALHAVSRAGAVAGKRALVTGSGPIGVLVVAALRYAGALEIVATDLHATALAKAVEMGATRTVNVGAAPGLKTEEFTADKGYFDVVVECTGASAVLPDALAVVRPRGVVVQVGQGGDVVLPIGPIVGKEINLQGAFRFHEEFGLAARLIRERRIDVRPIITAEMPLERAVEAFEMAGDRTAHTKVQLSFA